MKNSVELLEKLIKNHNNSPTTGMMFSEIGFEKGAGKIIDNHYYMFVSFGERAFKELIDVNLEFEKPLSDFTEEEIKNLENILAERIISNIFKSLTRID